MNPTMELARASFAHFAELFWPTIEPAPLEPGWHMREVCKALQAVAEGRIMKLAISIPPRHSKSLLASVLWPAWLHTRDPKIKLMAASHTLGLALKFSKMHREILRAPLFVKHYPWAQIKHGSDAAGSWELTSGGRRFSGAVNAKFTGHGGNVMIIDDPHDLNDLDSVRAREQVAHWYRSSWFNRRDDATTTREVVIMQRSAADDLIGELKSFGFQNLAIPALRTDDPPPTDIEYDDPRALGEALVPERMPAEELRVLEREMGRHYHAVYQQDPRPLGDNMFLRGWFTEPPDGWEQHAVRRVRYWDKAATAAEPGKDPDWTVGVLMAAIQIPGKPRQFVVENIVRMRASPGQTQARQVALIKADNEAYQNVLTAEEQEPGSSGKEAMVNRALAFRGYAFHPDVKTGPKEERWFTMSVQAEAGNVHMVRAPWNGRFLDELESLPNARHDDQADAAAGALAMMLRQRRYVL